MLTLLQLRGQEPSRRWTAALHRKVRQTLPGGASRTRCCILARITQMSDPVLRRFSRGTSMACNTIVRISDPQIPGCFLLLSQRPAIPAGAACLCPAGRLFDPPTTCNIKTAPPRVSLQSSPRFSSGFVYFRRSLIPRCTLYSLPHVVD